MRFSDLVKGFIANPFDPNGDGKTGLVELFAALGLCVVIIFAWQRMLGVYLEA